VQTVHWSPDGARLALQVAPGGGERTRVVLVRPDGAEERTVAPDARAVTLGCWARDGHRLGVTLFDDSGDGSACLLDVRDGTSTPLAVGRAARVCAVDRDGRRAVVRLGPRGDRGLELVDLVTGRRQPLLPGGGALVAEARFSGDGLSVHTDAGATAWPCSPSTCAADRPRGSWRSGPTPTSTRPRSTRMPHGSSWCGTRAGAAPWNCSTCAPGALRRCRPYRAGS
jgi:hypothetical protein